ncbi:hypothetical protein Dip518_001227 [Parelusimicrobium proximum]|uniref:hypothetical protein n=1 Tax=Parelusimicrobium proximum TaxID=3228953 RepID=UPI003D177E37
MEEKTLPPQETAKPLKAPDILVMLGTFFKAFAKSILSFIFGTMAITVLGTALVYTLIQRVHIPLWLQITVTALSLLAYLAFSFFYTIVMSGMSAAKNVFLDIEDFIAEVIDRLKNKMEGHVNSMQEGMTKKQASLLLKNSIREVVNEYKAVKANSVIKAGLIFILSLTLLVVRRVLTGRIKEATGMEIGIGTIFAGPAVIFGAVVFHLRFIINIFLFAGYIFAIIILALPLIILKF